MPTPGIIGDVLRRAPKSEVRPELEQVAREAKVRSEIERAWSASNPNATQDQRREMRFRVRQNSDGIIWAEPLARPGKPGEPFMRFKEPGWFSDVHDWLMGEKTIIEGHTHPFASSNLGASPADRKYHDKAGIPGIIASRDGMHYFGPALPGRPDTPFWQFWK